MTKFQQFIASKGMNLVAVSKSTGINIAQLSLFSTNRHNWNRKTLKALVMYFRCTPNDLIDFNAWIEWAEKKDLPKYSAAAHPSHDIEN